jgi:hypothetical protein
MTRLLAQCANAARTETAARKQDGDIQQKRRPPTLGGGTTGQIVAVAASAFSAGRGAVRTASAPALARQPLSDGTIPILAKPRSLTASLSKDAKGLNDRDLTLEIKLIQDWLSVYPSSSESNHLRSELALLEDEELMRAEEREARGERRNEPEEGTVAGLLSLVHRGRLEAQHPFSVAHDLSKGRIVGHKHLTKGTMEWQLEPPQSGQYGIITRQIQVKFTPNSLAGSMRTLAWWRSRSRIAAATVVSSKMEPQSAIPRLVVSTMLPCS